MTSKGHLFNLHLKYEFLIIKKDGIVLCYDIRILNYLRKLNIVVIVQGRVTNPP